MKPLTATLLTGVLMAPAPGVAQGERAVSLPGPVGVSPGGLVHFLSALACPTFSWTAAQWATAYELIVYRVSEERFQAPEPLLRTHVPGGASSWTPPADRCFARGHRYAWSLRPVGGESEWSDAMLFEVGGSPTEAEYLDALSVIREYLAAGSTEDPVGIGAAPEAAIDPPGAPAGALASDPPAPAEGGLAERAHQARRAAEGAPGRAAEVEAPLGLSLVAVKGEVPDPAGATAGLWGMSHSPDGYGVVAENTDPDGFALELRGRVSSNSELFLHHDGNAVTALGRSALANNTSGIRNTAVGYLALLYNTTGYRNTAVGDRALSTNSTGFKNTATGELALAYNNTGSHNTATGAFALFANTTGYRNTAVGDGALFFNTTGDDNTALGVLALYGNTTGSNNIALGVYALRSNDDGDRNVAVGKRALEFNTTSDNTAIGTNALDDATTGGFNTALGYGAGSFVTTGDSNILIRHGGYGPESHTIRLGYPGNDPGEQNRAFIAGIRGTTTGMNNAIAVLIDSAGQLGTVSSSRRVKQDIEDLGPDSERLLELRPVRFRYKDHAAQGDPSPQYGLIAEEVAEVFPELVVYDAEGRPETVRYHLLPPLLLHELQRLRAAYEARSERRVR